MQSGTGFSDFKSFKIKQYSLFIMQLLFILEKKNSIFSLILQGALPQLAPAHFHFTGAVAEGKAEEIQFNLLYLAYQSVVPIPSMHFPQIDLLT